MIMIIDYDFLSYVIFDQQLKITFSKSSALPPEKICSPLFNHLPLKMEKVPPFCKQKFFEPLLQKGGGDTVNI